MFDALSGCEHCPHGQAFLLLCHINMKERPLLFSCVTLIPIRLNPNLCSTLGFQPQSFQPQMILILTCEKFKAVHLKVGSGPKVLMFLLTSDSFVSWSRTVPPCEPTADDMLYHISITAISVSLPTCQIHLTQQHAVVHPVMSHNSYGHERSFQYHDGFSFS